MFNSRPLIVTSCDDRYLWPWACTLYSAVLNAATPFRLILANVNGLLSERGQRVAREYFAFLGINGEIVDVSLDIQGIQRYHWNATTFARLALLDTVDERFLWLDSDTILCPNWTDIFAKSEALMEDPQMVACAVVDRSATIEAFRQSGTNSAFALAGDSYVNAGVLYLDPIRWRSGAVDRDWLKLVATQSERGFEFPDQDILNFVLVGKIGLLPAAFNHIVSEPTNGAELILHFAGGPKPWWLSEAGRALFVAVESVNYDRPRHQLSTDAQSWKLFPRYWEIERSLSTSLAKGDNADLARALQTSRKEQIVDMSIKERVKFWGIRLLSTRYLSLVKSTR